jgi:hypothetical protein
MTLLALYAYLLRENAVKPYGQKAGRNFSSVYRLSQESEAESKTQNQKPNYYSGKLVESLANVG